MVTMPTIDTIRTGHRIEKLRILSGLSVKQLQKILGLGTPQAIYINGKGVLLYQLSIT